MSHDLHLISFDICPYVERSRVVLEEKDADYRSTDIDLSDKPEWFLDISPRGKVPVLVVDDKPVFESMVINELLEELYPEPALFPDEAVARAQARSWMVFADDELMGPLATLWFDADDEAEAEAREALEENFRRIDETLAAHDGNYFLEDGFSLVDAVFAPLFTRWPVVDEIGHADLLEDFDAVRDYRDAILERSSVQAARADDLVEKLLDYDLD